MLVFIGGGWGGVSIIKKDGGVVWSFSLWIPQPINQKNLKSFTDLYIMVEGGCQYIGFGYISVYPIIYI